MTQLPDAGRARPPRVATLVPTTVVATVLAVLVAAYGPGTTGDHERSAAPSVPAAEWTVEGPAAAPDVLLRLPGGTATAVLTGSGAARQLEVMLPLRLVLRDPMGQAKSGPLPAPLDVAGEARTTDPELGGLYYWPPSGDLAIVYDDLGQAVPPPGLVRLGTVTSGLPTVAAAGNRFTVSLEPSSGRTPTTR